ncbi:hypothetical protein Taro_010994 [Colocasia esculenta]|uniref:Uncharacterized protein n=1 Tax=Colocasia esculenta TaxID=4460 RepID=A0A843U4P9_COLES|nr:hypothetical protein [Colocasia esculenta]
MKVSINSKHTRIQSHNTRNYPGSDLLSLGVLRPVPEKQLRIPLTRVQSPYGHHNTQLSWSSFTRRELQHPGYPTRSSFTTEGKQHTGSPGLPSQQKGNNYQTLSRKSKPLDQAFASSDLKLIALRARDLTVHSLRTTQALLGFLIQHGEQRALDNFEWDAWL